MLCLPFCVIILFALSPDNHHNFAEYYTKAQETIESSEQVKNSWKGLYSFILRLTLIKMHNRKKNTFLWVNWFNKEYIEMCHIAD